MALTMEERTEVILMSGERSFCVIATDFNNWHPEKLPISYNTCQVLNYQIPRNWDCGWQCDSSVALFGWPLHALLATVPVSRNLEIKHLTVLCEIVSLSRCRLLKSAALTRKLSSPDIKMTSILSSLVKVCVFQCQPTALLRASGSTQGG